MLPPILTQLSWEVLDSVSKNLQETDLLGTNPAELDKCLGYRDRFTDFLFIFRFLVCYDSLSSKAANPAELDKNL